MGLDDFMSDSKRKKLQERSEELDQSYPPDGSNSWVEFEPGDPGWEDKVEGQELENQLEDSDEEEMLLLKRKGECEKFISSDKYSDLGDEI